MALCDRLFGPCENVNVCTLYAFSIPANRSFSLSLSALHSTCSLGSNVVSLLITELVGGGVVVMLYS